MDTLIHLFCRNQIYPDMKLLGGSALFLGWITVCWAAMRHHSAHHHVKKVQSKIASELYETVHEKKFRFAINIVIKMLSFKHEGFKT